jgi:integrase/recombinase XerD
MADFVAKALAKSIANVGRFFGRASKQREMSWSLFDDRGRRKYLVSAERRVFLREALFESDEVATFCAVLTFCGPRISEALAVTHERVDCADCAITFETLKRRERGVMRSVPVPSDLLALLDRVHGCRAARLDPVRANERLWSWSRTTAWRRVKGVMLRAGIPAHLATPKSLRHGFAASAAMNSVVITLIQKWLGHAKLETTEEYTKLVGKEERALVQRTWVGVRSALRGNERARHS